MMTQLKNNSERKPSQQLVFASIARSFYRKKLLFFLFSRKLALENKEKLVKTLKQK